MAEETEKKTEPEKVTGKVPTTAEEMAEHLAQLQTQGGFTEFNDLWFPINYDWHFGPFRLPQARTFRYRDPSGGGDFIILRIHNTSQAANTNELALAGEPTSKGEAQVESKTETFKQLSADDEATARILINSALAEVERSRAIMQRDEEEVQRLKEETRSILTKLRAA